MKAIRSQRRLYSSVLKYSERAKPEHYGQLAEDTHHVTPLEEIEYQSSRHRRLHPHSLQGKTISHQLLVIPEPISKAISALTLNHQPQELRKAAARYYVELQETGAHQPAGEKEDVDAQLSATFLHNYGSIYNVLSELRRRMDKGWVPKSILDVGFGPASGLIAFNELFKEAEKPDLVSEAVVMGHKKMKSRAKLLLNAQGDDKSTVLQVLPGMGTKQYDLIIATHQLYRSEFHFPSSVDDHTTHLLSLLSPKGVLVLVERGDPRGFESIARARQIMFRPEDHLDDVSKHPREWKPTNENPVHLKILAPCSHHGKCPLQVGLDLRRKTKNPGYFNWCKFGQMVQRPKYTQELKKGQYLANQWDEETPGKGPGGKHLAGSGRPFGLSYETATHSYLIVQRQEASDTAISPSDSWPRILRTPLKRDKHVVMEVCAPNADIEQWTVTKGFDKQAYHDARKATGGDLWALKAKTIQQRGGNRKQLRKSDKVEAKKQASEKPPSTSEFNAELYDEQVVDAAYAGIEAAPKSRRKVSISRGYDAHPDHDVPLEEYFEQLSREFEQTPKFQKQMNKEKKAEYREHRKSRWM